MLLLLQKQCHMSSPEPYTTHMSSSQAWTMVSFTLSRSVMLRAGMPMDVGRVKDGDHLHKQSLARQWGKSEDEMGVRFCGYGAGLLSDVEGGIGACHGLVSRVFCHLASLGGVGVGSQLLLCVCARYLVVAVLVSKEGFNPNEEGFDFEWDGDIVEEEVPRQECSSGWGVSRVVFAGDIMRVYHPIAALQ